MDKVSDMYQWKEDEAVEMAMLKSCLLFSGKNIKLGRGIILQKKILSLIIQEKIKVVSDVERYCFGEEITSENGAICSSALQILKNKKLIQIDEGGKILLSNHTQEEVEEYAGRFIKNKYLVIDYILNNAKEAFKSDIHKIVQVKTNICNCFEYYFKVSSLKFLGYDDMDEEVPIKLKEIVSVNLTGSDLKICDHIIYAIGKLIAEPNMEQRQFLEVSAQVALTSQIIGTDSLLRNFRKTIIGSKCFVLDTDVVLYCITKNSKRGKNYLKMIQNLLSCGCKFYIPEEVLEEVYDHAEAATKRYHYQKEMIENSDFYIVVSSGTNVFIEDYMQNTIKGSEEAWNRYIQNYFDPDYGVTLIKNKVKQVFGNKIVYGDYPNSKCIKIDSIEYDTLYNEVYGSTVTSPNAQFRDDDKNRKIAGVDTKLYLAVKKANQLQIEREGGTFNKKGILSHNFYVMTSSTRSHVCAKKLGLEYDVLCSPRAMIAYLSETGLMDNGDFNISELLDNPFMAYIVHESWDDIDKIIKAGVDVRGKELVRLRLDMQKNVHKLLTSIDSQEYKNAYKDTIDMGYSFNDSIKAIMEESQKNQSENEELKQELARIQAENKRIKQENEKKKYLTRIRSSKKHKK